jgi:regulator of RNase E activity RraB
LHCDYNQLTSLRYAPPNLEELTSSCNQLTSDWQNLSIEQINIKNINHQLYTLKKLTLINRNKLIYNTWVSYFDTPNDDHIAKHALLLFKQISS